jgi:hypothetical protein
MIVVPLAIVEEISDRLRQALKVSEAAEQLVERDPREVQGLSLLCAQAVSLERVAAMLSVISAMATEAASCASGYQMP